MMKLTAFSVYYFISTYCSHCFPLTVIVASGVPSVWEVDSGREVWRAPEPVMSQPDKEGVTLVNHLAYSKTLDSVVMTTYDHSILFAKTSSMKIWKQVAMCLLTVDVPDI